MRLRAFSARLSRVSGRRGLSSYGPEKAAPSGEKAKPLIPRKHFLWIVPLISAGLVTTVVANSKPAKDWAEALAPQYVDLVRQRIGFEEENLGEELRVLEVLLSNEQPVDVTVTLSHISPPTGKKQQRVLRGVSGTTTIPELLERIAESCGDGSGKLLVSLSFEDCADSQVASSYEERLAALRAVWASKFRPPPLPEDPPSARPLAGATKASWVASEWAAGNTVPAFASPLHHCSTAAGLLSHLHLYLSRSQQRQQQQQLAVFRSLTRGALRSLGAAQHWQPTQAQLKHERAAELELRLAELRAELKGGMGMGMGGGMGGGGGGSGGMRAPREVDAINDDIAVVSRELGKAKGWWFY